MLRHVPNFKKVRSPIDLNDSTLMFKLKHVFKYLREWGPYLTGKLENTNALRVNGVAILTSSVMQLCLTYTSRGNRRCRTAIFNL